MIVATSLSEKGSDPLEANRFHLLFCLAGEGQTPFRILALLAPLNHSPERSAPQFSWPLANHQPLR